MATASLYGVFRGPAGGLITRRNSVLLCIGIFAVLWLWTLGQIVTQGPGPNGETFAVDYSHTYSAVVAIQHGLNPYDYRVLSRVQRELLEPKDLPVATDPRTVLIGTSPFYLWLLQPMVQVPFQAAALFWIVTTSLLAALGFWRVLAWLGWRRRLIPTIVFLATPAAALAAFLGNTVDLSFTGIALSLPLLRRYPVAAGIVLSLTILKLPAMCPVAFVIVLTLAPHRWRVVAGFLGAFFSRHLIAAVGIGPESSKDWAAGLFSFSHSMGLQPNLIGFSGIYASAPGHGGRFTLELFAAAIALTVTMAWYWRHRGEITLLNSGWLWGLWLLATPYAHFVDEIVLAIPIAALIGRDGARLEHPISIAALGMWIGSVFLFSAHLGPAGLLWIPLLGLTVSLALGARQFSDRPLAAHARLRQRAEPYLQPEFAAPVAGDRRRAIHSGV